MTAPAAGDPVDFLRRLRPRGPWALTAIIPDGQTTTQTFDPDSESGLRAFVRQHNGTRNLYYSVNRTRKAMSKKAAKVDISAIEYLLADLDPKEDESAEAAKARYLAALETHEPKPTAIIDSGNGIPGAVEAGGTDRHRPVPARKGQEWQSGPCAGSGHGGQRR
jgi:hypothetical protein